MDSLIVVTEKVVVICYTVRTMFLLQVMHVKSAQVLRHGSKSENVQQLLCSTGVLDTRNQELVVQKHFIYRQRLIDYVGPHSNMFEDKRSFFRRRNSQIRCSSSVARMAPTSDPAEEALSDRILKHR